MTGGTLRGWEEEAKSGEKGEIVPCKNDKSQSQMRAIILNIITIIRYKT